MSNKVGDKIYNPSHQTSQTLGGSHKLAPQSLSKEHQTYINYVHNTQTDSQPTQEEIKSYLRYAYLGFVPIPLSLENLAKSYAFFKGAAHKQTLHKILSEHGVALNLIPGLKNLTQQENFSLGRICDYVCLDNEEETLEQLEQKAQIIQQKANLYIEDIFQNPSVVKSALKAVSKKQWGQLLIKPPSNPDLLKATANLSSDDFFKNGMHLAFLEIEPDIYSSIKPEFVDDFYVGFKAKKYLRILLEIELTLKDLREKQLNEKRLKDDAKLYKGDPKEALILESEVRKTTSKDHNLHVENPQEKPTFLQKMIREELGHSASVDRQQVQKILQAAEEILNAPKTEPSPEDFLHKKHPEKQKPRITLDSMDLSTR
jgi:hypothetical protein